MCDNCTCNEKYPSYEALEKSVAEQRRIIDDLDAAIGDQQAIIGELQTENKRLKGMVAKGGKLTEKLIDILAGAA